MMKKYFFFDIDGTLQYWSSGKQIVPDSVYFTLRKLKENGHFTAIATGRSYAMSVDVMRKFGLHNMVHDGGNGVTIEDEMLGVEPLDKEVCIALIHECEEKGFPWGLSPENKRYRYVKDDRFMEATKDDYLPSIVKNDLNPEDFSEIYKVYIACKPHEEKRLETLKKITWCRYHETYFFVEPTDKARGIYRIMDHFHAPYEDAVVFGDDLNDLSMFDKEWFSIAMGNGKKQLKDIADYVTDNAENDGIYKACKKFGWI